MMGGILQGEQKEYYPNGNLCSQYFYKSGKLEGERKVWHNNGNLCSREFYKDGKLEGEVCQWYDDGRLANKKYYKNGKLNGVSKQWFDNRHLWCHNFHQNGEFVCYLTLRIKFAISNFKKRWKNRLRKRMVNMMSQYLIKDLAILTSKWVI